MPAQIGAKSRSCTTASAKLALIVGSPLKHLMATSFTVTRQPRASNATADAPEPMPQRQLADTLNRPNPVPLQQCSSAAQKSTLDKRQHFRQAACLVYRPENHFLTALSQQRRRVDRRDRRKRPGSAQRSARQQQAHEPRSQVAAVHPRTVRLVSQCGECKRWNKTETETTSQTFKLFIFTQLLKCKSGTTAGYISRLI